VPVMCGCVEYEHFDPPTVHSVSENIHSMQLCLLYTTRRTNLIRTSTASKILIVV